MPRQKSGCYRQRQSPCQNNANCTWVKRKGCKVSPYRPRKKSRKTASRASVSRSQPCSRKRKGECHVPCKWHRGVGCRSMGDELVLGAAKRLVDIRNAERDEELAIAMAIRQSLMPSVSRSVSRSSSAGLFATPSASSVSGRSLAEALNFVRQQLPSPASPFARSASMSPLISPPASANTDLYQLIQQDRELTGQIDEATRAGRMSAIVPLTAKQVQVRNSIQALQSLGAVPESPSSASASSSLSTPVATPLRLSPAEQMRREAAQRLKLQLVGIPLQRAKLLQQMGRSTGANMRELVLKLKELDDATAALQAQIQAIERE